MADEAATARLGEDIAMAVQRGDLITLSGELGAGKTTLARALIRALAADHELEVPSPTYTLVQTYATNPQIAHFDFYRLSDPAEIDDLGLEDALDDGVAIVEWPENGGVAMPDATISVTLAEQDGGGRTATLDIANGAEPRLRRSLEIRAFLDKAGWGNASRMPLIGDASTRSYETTEISGRQSRLIMNAPEQPDGPPIRDGKPYSRIAKLSESVTPFVAVDHCLRERGFSAPEIYAADLDSGFLLLEHLGAESIVDRDRSPIPERYLAATELLSDMHRLDWPRNIEAPFGARHDLPPYDREAMMIEVQLLLDWYMPAMTGAPADDGDRNDFQRAWNTVIDGLAGVENSLLMRDFHSPNIIWRDDREGHDRLGLIDFQDALVGPSTYDLASLAQDARATVSADLEAQLIARYCELRASKGKFDEPNFRKAYSIMSVQRCSKILGIFVRLDRRDGKPGYLKHLPRMSDYLGRSIGHDALAPVRELYERWRLFDVEPA